MSDDWLLVALVCLSTYMLTQLATAGRIFQAPRELLQNWFEQRWERRHNYDPTVHGESEQWQSMGGYFLSCPWCVSVWVGGGVTLATYLAVGLHVPVLVWLASAGVTGYLSSREGSD